MAGFERNAHHFASSGSGGVIGAENGLIGASFAALYDHVGCEALDKFSLGDGIVLERVINGGERCYDFSAFSGWSVIGALLSIPTTSTSPRNSSEPVPASGYGPG